MSTPALDLGMVAATSADRASPENSSGFNDVRTTGDHLSGLVWRGLLLTVVTLGIYRFWYKTDLRRWYWRHTVVGGSALEYRGTAKELFIGFLIALAVVMPLYILGFMLGLFATETINLTVKPILAAIFVLLVQYGSYRSRRYRLTRTVWRGLRFDQTGSAVTYALKSLGWMIVTVLTLGIAFPWMRRALERYRIENTHFGSASGTFDAAVAPLMKRWLALLLPTLLLLAIGGYEAARTAVFIPFLGQYRISGTAMFLLFLAFVWPLALWPAYRAAEFRGFTSATKLGPVSFVSMLKTKKFYGLYGKLIGLAVGGLIALIMFLTLTLQALGPLFARTIGSVAIWLLLLLPYLGGFLGYSWLKEVVFNQGFWKHASATLAIENLAAADEILGHAVKDEAATGEGFADALDFGGV